MRPEIGRVQEAHVAVGVPLASQGRREEGFEVGFAGVDWVWRGRGRAAGEDSVGAMMVGSVVVEGGSV